MQGKIDFTRSGLEETTSVESDQTRNRVATTLDLINQMKENLTQEINQVKENVETTTRDLARKIDSTQSGLTETTLDQSNQTRNKVDGTISLVHQLKEELDNAKQDIARVGLFVHLLCFALEADLE